MKALIKKALEDIRCNGKTCSCGKKYHSLPLKAVYKDDGILAAFWWNCECKSTMLKKVYMRSQKQQSEGL